MTDQMTVSLRLNGVDQELTIEPRWTLADVLRDRFALRSIHLGCELGACGGCMVLVDGEPANSCTLLAVQVDQRAVDTVEGLSDSPAMQRLQAAFHDHHALQCGYCTPGVLVSLYGLVGKSAEAGRTTEAGRTAEVTEADVRERLRGNLCRCTGYQSIVTAGLAAARATEAAHGTETASATATATADDDGKAGAR